MSSWWSPTILGGDVPLDCFIHIGRHFKLPSIHPLDWSEEKKAKIKEKLKKCKKQDFEEVLTLFDTHFAVQALVVLMMAAGVRIPAIIRKKALESAEFELEQTNLVLWNDESARRREVNRFIIALKDYRGKPHVAADNAIRQRKHAKNARKGKRESEWAARLFCDYGTLGNKHLLITHYSTGVIATEFRRVCRLPSKKGFRVWTENRHGIILWDSNEDQV